MRSKKGDQRNSRVDRILYYEYGIGKKQIVLETNRITYSTVIRQHGVSKYLPSEMYSTQWYKTLRFNKTAKE